MMRIYLIQYTNFFYLTKCHNSVTFYWPLFFASVSVVQFCKLINSQNKIERLRNNRDLGGLRGIKGQSRGVELGYRFLYIWGGHLKG